MRSLVVPAQRRAQSNTSALARFRNHFKPPAQLLSTTAHAFQTMADASVGRLKSTSIVFQRKDDQASLDPQLGVGARARGVSRNVVDAFFENEEDFAANVSADAHVAIQIGRVQMKLNVPCGQG